MLFSLITFAFFALFFASALDLTTKRATPKFCKPRKGIKLLVRTALLVSTLGHYVGACTIDLSNQQLTFANVKPRLDAEIAKCHSSLKAAEGPVDLSRNKLTSLPNNLFDNLTELKKTLNLHSSGITSLPVGIFDTLTQITTDLNLSNNELTALPAGLFDKLTKLNNKLNLSDNRLISLPAGVFDKLTQLEYDLAIADNKLTSLPDQVFDSLVNFNLKLTLDSNELTTLPGKIFDKLTQLTRELGLSFTKITALPFGIFDKLTQINVKMFTPFSCKNPLPLAPYGGCQEVHSNKAKDVTLPGRNYGYLRGIECQIDLSSQSLDVTTAGTALAGKANVLTPNCRNGRVGITLFNNSLTSLPETLFSSFILSDIAELDLGNNQIGGFKFQNVGGFFGRFPKLRLLRVCGTLQSSLGCSNPVQQAGYSGCQISNNTRLTIISGSSCDIYAAGGTGIYGYKIEAHYTESKEYLEQKRLDDLAAAEAEAKENATIGGSVGAAVAVLLAVAFFVYWKRRPKLNEYGVPILDFDKLVMGKFLGKGAFGNVNLAIHQGTDVAVKLLELQTKESLEELDKEIFINTLLPPHPHVVKMLGVAEGSKKGIVMELYDLRSVEDYRKDHPEEWADLSFPKKVKIAIGMSAGLCCMHEQRVIHRDIACRNGLLRPDHNCSVADFGLSLKLKDGETESISQFDPLVPIISSAPETLTNGKYSTKSDVYQFGIFLFEMFMSMQPYSDLAFVQECSRNKTWQPFISKVVDGFRPSIPDDWPPMLTSLITLCWSKDPTLRPSMNLVNMQLRELEEFVTLKNLPLPSTKADEVDTLDTYDACDYRDNSPSSSAVNASWVADSGANLDTYQQSPPLPSLPSVLETHAKDACDVQKKGAELEKEDEPSLKKKYEEMEKKYKEAVKNYEEMEKKYREAEKKNEERDRVTKKLLAELDGFRSLVASRKGDVAIDVQHGFQSILPGTPNMALLD